MSFPAAPQLSAGTSWIHTCTASAGMWPAEVASVVQAALYRDGVRVSSPASLAETFRELREQPDGMAWIGLARPTERELLSLAAEFDLHPLAVEDAMEAHQRPGSPPLLGRAGLFGVSPAAFIKGDRQMAQGEHGLTDEDLKAWRPAAATRGRRSTKK